MKNNLENLSPHYQQVIKDSKESIHLATTLDSYVAVSKQLLIIQENQKSVLESIGRSLRLL